MTLVFKRNYADKENKIVLNLCIHLLHNTR